MSKLEDVKILKERGLSQREMAEKLGISRRTIRYYLENLPPQFIKNFVINDQHRPFQDDKAVNLALQVAEDLEPDVITINGDNGDCWEISKFVKPEALRSVASLSHEIEDHRKWLHGLKKQFPQATIRYIFGNHEHRWQTYIMTHARELHGLRGLSLEEQLDFGPLGIEPVYSGNKESSWLWGKLLIGHFDKVSKHSSYTAKLLVDEKGISLLQSHTHRGGAFFKRIYDRDVVGYENFCLCDLEPPYLDRPNWQLGFSIVYKDQDSDMFHVEQHPIIRNGKNYRVFFEGRVYQA